MLNLWLVILLDQIFKDPVSVYHPVQFFGLLIERGEIYVRRLYKDKDLVHAGTLLVVAVVLIVLLLYAVSRTLLYTLHPLLAVLVDLYLAYALLSSGSLMAEGKRIYGILKTGDLDSARKSLSYLVSRETSDMTQKDILRGAVETLSENITDGIVSPLFYFGLLGVPGLILFKVISTFDSMIGYKNKRYVDLGRFAAKSDDVLNFIPARIAGVIVIVAAFIVGEDYRSALRIFKRDRLKHASPNSACTESAIAGALGVKLGGSAIYFGEVVEKPVIGDGEVSEDIEILPRVNRLIFVSTLLSGLVLTAFYGLRGHYIGF